MFSIKASPLLAIALWFSATSAQAWIPEECSNASQVRRDKEGAFHPSADPADPQDAPVAFPKTDPEVVEDLRAAYTRTWANLKESDLPEDERELSSGLQRGSLGFEVLRVEDWSPLRCTGNPLRKLHFLVRVRRAKTGEEIARFVLDESGTPEQYVSRSLSEEPGWARSWVGIAPAQAAARQAGYGAAKDAQLVTTRGGTLRCDVLVPCVAMRSEGQVLVVAASGVYALDPERPKVSLEEMNRSAGRAAALEAARAAGFELLSVGESWRTFRRVGPLSRE